MVGNWVIVMVGWMLFCECSSLKCLAPLKNQASLWSTASIWAATGRWAPRDHCTSLDPFFNEGAMRPSDHQIQGLGSRNALKYTEVAFPSMSKIAVDPWVLHIPDIPGSRIHFWYLCMSSSGVCVHISQKHNIWKPSDCQHATIFMPSDCWSLEDWFCARSWFSTSTALPVIGPLRLPGLCCFLRCGPKDIAKEWRERGTCEHTSYRNLCKLNVWRICRILRSDCALDKKRVASASIEWSLAVPRTSSSITAEGDSQFFHALDIQRPWMILLIHLGCTFSEVLSRSKAIWSSGVLPAGAKVGWVGIQSMKMYQYIQYIYIILYNIYIYIV